jgi:hypothetical protein
VGNDQIETAEDMDVSQLTRQIVAMLNRSPGRVSEHGLRKMASRFFVPFAADSGHKMIKGIDDRITALRNEPGLTDADRKEIAYYLDAASRFRRF